MEMSQGKGTKVSISQRGGSYCPGCLNAETVIFGTMVTLCSGQLRIGLPMVRLSDQKPDLVPTQP